MVKKERPELKRILMHFAHLFRERTGDSYIPTWGRDYRIINDMLASLTELEITNLITYYFEYPRRIYSLPYMKCDLNELRQRYKQENVTQTQYEVKDKY